jgi:hypothetical protein
MAEAIERTPKTERTASGPAQGWLGVDVVNKNEFPA